MGKGKGGAKELNWPCCVETREDQCDPGKKNSCGEGAGETTVFIPMGRGAMQRGVQEMA